MLLALEFFADQGRFYKLDGFVRWFGDFAGLRVIRSEAYDALLQGQFRNSEVTVGSDAVARLVWEGAVGVTKSWEDLQLTFAVNAKSAEAEFDGVRRSHYWGGLYLNLSF